MTNRNPKQELYYCRYIDMEDGDSFETINYESLFELLKEILSRLEKLENQNSDYRADK